MLVTKPIALYVNDSMPQESKNLVKPQKQIQNFIENYENSESKPKKQERFLENKLFVHWDPLDCKFSLSSAEPGCEKGLVSRILRKTKKKKKFF